MLEKTQRIPKIVDSVEEEAPIIIPRCVIDILKGSEKFFELMVLLVFYCYVAKEQKTNKIYASTKLTKQKIKAGTKKTQTLRRELVHLGLIKEIKERKSNGKLGPTCYHLLWDIEGSHPKF